MLNKDFWSQFSCSRVIFSKPCCFIKDKHIMKNIERVETYIGIQWPFITGIRAGGLGEFFVAKKSFILQCINDVKKMNYSITTSNYNKYCYGDHVPFDIIFSNNLIESNKYLFSNIIINSSYHIQKMMEEDKIIFGDESKYIKPYELLTIYEELI